MLKEDFTTARLRKEQIELYKRLIFEKLEIQKLLEPHGLIVENDVCSKTYATKPTLPNAPTLVEVANILENSKAADDGVDSVNSFDKINHEDLPYSPQLKCRASPKGSPNFGSLRRRNKSAPRNTYDCDEREIPTLRLRQ